MCSECGTVCEISVVIIFGHGINDEDYQVGDEESAQNAEQYAKNGLYAKTKQRNEGRKYDHIEATRCARVLWLQKIIKS